MLCYRLTKCLSWVSKNKGELKSKICKTEHSRGPKTFSSTLWVGHWPTLQSGLTWFKQLYIIFRNLIVESIYVWILSLDFVQTMSNCIVTKQAEECIYIINSCLRYWYICRFYVYMWIYWLINVVCTLNFYIFSQKMNLKFQLIIHQRKSPPKWQ